MERCRTPSVGFIHEVYGQHDFRRLHESWHIWLGKKSALLSKFAREYGPGGLYNNSFISRYAASSTCLIGAHGLYCTRTTQKNTYHYNLPTICLTYPLFQRHRRRHMKKGRKRRLLCRRHTKQSFRCRSSFSYRGIYFLCVNNPAIMKGHFAKRSRLHFLARQNRSGLYDTGLPTGNFYSKSLSSI